MKLSPGAVENIHFVTGLETQYIAQVSRFLGRQRHALEICIEGVWRRVESAASHKVRFQVPDLMLSVGISVVNKGNFHCVAIRINQMVLVPLGTKCPMKGGCQEKTTPMPAATK